MTTQRKWLMMGGLVVAAFSKFVVGISLAVPLLVAVVLLCPLAIYFGVRGMHKGQGSGHAGASGHSGAAGRRREPGRAGEPRARVK